VTSATAITDTAEPLNSLLDTRTGFLSSRLPDCILTASTDWIIWGLPTLLRDHGAKAVGPSRIPSSNRLTTTRQLRSCGRLHGGYSDDGRVRENQAAALPDPNTDVAEGEVWN